MQQQRQLLCSGMIARFLAQISLYTEAINDRQEFHHLVPVLGRNDGTLSQTDVLRGLEAARTARPTEVKVLTPGGAIGWPGNRVA